MVLAQDIKNNMLDPKKKDKTLKGLEDHMAELAQEFRLGTELLNLLQQYYNCIKTALFNFKEGNTRRANGDLASALSYVPKIRDLMKKELGEDHHMLKHF